MTWRHAYLCCDELHFPRNESSVEVGRIIEIDTDTDIAIFEKTETDTDSIFRKTEKYRLS